MSSCAVACLSAASAAFSDCGQRLCRHAPADRTSITLQRSWIFTRVLKTCATWPPISFGSRRCRLATTRSRLSTPPVMSELGKTRTIQLPKPRAPSRRFCFTRRVRPSAVSSSRSLLNSISGRLAGMLCLIDARGHRCMYVDTCCPCCCSKSRWCFVGADEVSSCLDEHGSSILSLAAESCT